MGFFLSRRTGPVLKTIRTYTLSWDKHANFRENYKWPEGLSPLRPRPVVPTEHGVQGGRKKNANLIRDRDIEVPHSNLLQQLYPTEKAEPGTNPHILKVALVGPVNAGKSTLVNSLVEEKISRVSKLAQTTTEVTKAYLNRKNTQIILYDTPGLPHHRKIRSSPTSMHEWAIVPQVDLVMCVFDGARDFLGETDEEVLNRLPTLLNKCEKRPEAIAVFTKADAIPPWKRDALLGEAVMDSGLFSWFCRTGKSRKDTLGYLRDFLMSRAKPGPWEWLEDKKTDMSNKDRAVETVREKLFRYTEEEIPYMTKVVFLGWQLTRLGALHLKLALYAPSKGSAKNLVGTRGVICNSISKASAESLMKLWQIPVTVDLEILFDPTVNSKQHYMEELSKKNAGDSLSLPE